MEELIKSNSGHLADWEELTWDDSTNNIRCYLGVQSVRQLEDFIKKFPIAILGPGVRIFLADSIYLIRKNMRKTTRTIPPFTQKTTMTKNRKQITDCNSS